MRLTRQLTALVLTPKTVKRNTRPETKNNQKNCPSYTPVWYGFYDLQPGNGAGPILTAQEPTRGFSEMVGGTKAAMHNS